MTFPFASMSSSMKSISAPASGPVPVELDLEPLTLVAVHSTARNPRALAGAPNPDAIGGEPDLAAGRRRCERDERARRRRELAAAAEADRLGRGPLPAIGSNRHCCGEDPRCSRKVAGVGKCVERHRRHGDRGEPGRKGAAATASTATATTHRALRARKILDTVGRAAATDFLLDGERLDRQNVGPTGVFVNQHTYVICPKEEGLCTG